MPKASVAKLRPFPLQRRAAGGRCSCAHTAQTVHSLHWARGRPRAAAPRPAVAAAVRRAPCGTAAAAPQRQCPPGSDSGLFRRH